MSTPGELNEAAAERAWLMSQKLRPGAVGEDAPQAWVTLSGGAKTYWRGIAAAARSDDSVATASPVVHDDLAVSVILAANEAIRRRRNWGDVDRLHASREFLASEPMVRLFSIWTATVAAQRDQYADQWEDARAEATRLRSREGDLEVWLQRIAEAFDMGTDDLTDEEVVSNLEELRSQRDELGQRVDQQNEELDALRRTNPSTTLSAAAVEVVRALNAAGIVGDDTAGAGWPWIGKAVQRTLDELQRLRDEIAAVTVELVPDVPAEFIDAHGLAAGVTRLVHERDEARADLVRSTDTVAFLRDELSTEADRAGAHFDRAMDAEVQVERLRAAQQLPDCGHPNHGGAEHRCEPFLQQLPDAPSPKSHVMALSQHIGRTSCVCTENGDVCPGHELLDDLAGTLTEAADTSSDGGATAPSQATVLRAKFGRRPGSSSASWEQVIEALDAHRARGGQEAGQ